MRTRDQILSNARKAGLALQMLGRFRVSIYEKDEEIHATVFHQKFKTASIVDPVVLYNRFRMVGGHVDMKDVNDTVLFYGNLRDQSLFPAAGLMLLAIEERYKA